MYNLVNNIIKIGDVVTENNIVLLNHLFTILADKVDETCKKKEIYKNLLDDCSKCLGLKVDSSINYDSGIYLKLLEMIQKYVDAVHNIAPWLSASLQMKCCQEYIDCCDEIKNVLDIINLTPEQTKKIENYINERINNQNN